MRTVLLASFLVGCGGLPLAPQAPTSGPRQVEWSEVTDTAPCFYFSGPAELGRDDHLGARAILSTSDAHLSLDFGNNVLFLGERREGRATLRRSSSHDHNEGKWEAEETLTLEASPDGSWVGRYHYDERDPETRAIGHCHIDAALQLR